MPRKRYRYSLHLRGDIVGGMCGSLGPPCIQCGDVSDVLCDGKVGRKLCSKPLCSRCAPEMGDNKNYCTEHTANVQPLVPVETPQQEWDRLCRDAGVKPLRGMSQFSGMCGNGVVINFTGWDEP